MQLQHFLLGLLLVDQALSVAPGISVSLPESGLQIILKTILPDLVAQIEAEKISIPDFTTEVDTPVGHIHVTVSDLVIDQVKVGSASASYAASGFNGDFSSISAVANCNWKWKTDGIIKISDSGSATISISGLSISSVIDLTATSAGEPHVSLASDSVDLGSWDLSLHSHYDWFYDLFKGTIVSDIQSATKGQLSTVIGNAIDTVNTNYLNTFPVEELVTSTLEINYQLVSDPVISASIGVFPVLGEFFYVGDQKKTPFGPSHNLPSSDGDSNLQAFVDEYVFNSLFWVLFDEGQLDYAITNADLPADSPIQLNTTDFQDFVPPLYTKYPNMLMEVDVKASTSPLASILGDSIDGFFNGTAEFYVLNGTSKIYVFTLGLNATTDIEASFNDTSNKIVATMESLSENIWLMTSTLGYFDVTNLQDTITLAISFVVLPEINADLAAGFSLPLLDGITLVDPQLKYRTGFLEVLSDFTFKAVTTAVNPYKITLN